MNKYIEKIAATYIVRPHSLDHGIENVSLGRAELGKYQKGVDDASTLGSFATRVGGGAILGGITGHLINKKLRNIGALVGAGVGAHAYKSHAHDKGMEHVEATHFDSGHK